MIRACNPSEELERQEEPEQQQNNLTAATAVQQNLTAYELIAVSMEIFEDGNFVIHIHDNSTLYLRHAWTPDQGYRYENNTIFKPNGEVFMQQ